MQAHLMRASRHVLAMVLILCAVIAAGGAQAAPYAALVMDARNGDVIFARNHDTKLHPASLTKMMTLYVAFEAVKHGEVTLDTQFTVSRRATQTTCVCLGLRPGQRISLRYLLRAAALRSANDASVVIAEGISGSVEAFAERMTRTARAMGMSNTTFRNPHGLTQAGHVSTARDMTILGRQLYFDYPQYFNMFSRRSDHAGVGVVPNTNRRFLDAYAGADGIKTGFTRAAGFNLTASAKRGNKHIIATMFGGTSAAARNAHVAELMDIGFSRAPNRVATRAPRTPAYQGRGTTAVAAAPRETGSARNPEQGGAAKTIRLQRAVRKSPRPLPRPVETPPEDLLIALRDSVDTAVAAVATSEQMVAAESTAQLAEADAVTTAPQTLAVTPPPREAAGLATPEQDEAAQLAAAVAAGFQLADPEAVDGAEQAQAEALATALVPETPADDAVASDASGHETSEKAPVAALARAAPPQRPESLARAVADAGSAARADIPEQAETIAADIAQAVQMASEAVEASAPSSPGLGEAREQQIAARDLLDDDTVWIGAADTLSGAASVAVPSVPSPVSDQVAEPTQLAAVVTDIQPASLTEMPEQRPVAAPDPGIILTSSSPDPQSDSLPGGPLQRDAEQQAIASVVEAHVETGQRMVRLSTSDSGRLWGVSLGQFNSRAAAERSLITVKMAEAASLGNGVSRIRQTSGRFEASFAGLTEAEAERACLRLSARAMDCSVARP